MHGSLLLAYVIPLSLSYNGANTANARIGCKSNGLLVNLCIEAGAPAAGPGITYKTGITSWNQCLVCLKSKEECMTSGCASGNNYCSPMIPLETLAQP